MKRQHGFTLIELMVAIVVMAMLAVMSWRGIEGMARAQEQNRARGDAVLTLQTTLSQWTADLDAMAKLSGTSTIDWDGRLLRITRRGTDDLRPIVHVVAWTLRTDAAGTTFWSRWQSAPLTRRDEWQAAWTGAAAWAQGDAASSDARGVTVTLMPVDSWQLYYFRNDTWSPAVGADVLASGNANAALPDGLRLVLNLPPGPALTGLLSRDWVRPNASIPKS